MSGETIISALLITLGLDATKLAQGQKAAQKALVDTGKASEVVNKALQRDADKTADVKEKSADKESKAVEQAAEKEAKARKAAADKGAKDTQAAADAEVKARKIASERVTDAIKKVRNEALTLLAVFTAGVGLKDFITNTVTSTAALGRNAAALNMNAQTLAEYQLAAKRAGATPEAMTAQLQQSQLASADANMGKMGEAENATLRWSTLGGSSPKEAMAALRKGGEDYLMERAKILQHIDQTQGRDRAAAIGLQMGISPELFNMMRQGPEAIRRMREEVSALAAAQAAAAGPAAKLRDHFIGLQQRLETLAVRVLTPLLPLFDMLVEKLEKIGDWALAHQDDITQWITGAVDAFKAFWPEVDKAVESVGGWKNALMLLAAGLAGLKVASILVPLIGVAASLTQIGAALGVIGGGGTALALLGKIGIAGALAWGALKLAKAAGLPETDQERGEAELAMGDYGGASTHMSAGSFMTGSVQRLLGNGRDAGETVKKLMAMGWTREQAAGLTANFVRESGLDPTKEGDYVNGKSTAYGIGQWHKDRQDEFARMFHHDIRGSTLDEQLQFAHFELTKGNEQAAGARLKAAKTAEDAGAIGSVFYERPGDQRGEAEKRAALAGAILAKTGQANAAAAAALPTTAQMAGFGGGNQTTTHIANDSKVGVVNIQTQATDAQGIARDIGVALKDSLTWQANSGL